MVSFEIIGNFKMFLHHKYENTAQIEKFNYFIISVFG